MNGLSWGGKYLALGRTDLTVGIVTVYPPQGSKHARFGGVASYSKNLAASLSEKCRVVILAERESNCDDEYSEVPTVRRCWTKGLMYPFQVYRSLQYNNTDVVHIQHEMYLYGGLGSAIAFLLMLGFIRFLRKPIVVTLHGVVPTSKVGKRFLKENWIKGTPLVMRTGLIFLVKMIVILSTSIIVHEEEFKKILTMEYKCPARRIFVIHHGIEEKNLAIESKKAKQILGFVGNHVLLFFGYITGYKNVELLLESAQFLRTENWVMVIAGGKHPRLKADHGYRRYVSDLRDKASRISGNRILFNGFIAENDVPLYLSATDLLVFPYKTVMSASGPMCMAISYKRPFLVSSSFGKMVAKRELVFRACPQELARKIETFLWDRRLRCKAQNYIQQLSRERSWHKVAGETFELYESMTR